MEPIVVFFFLLPPSRPKRMGVDLDCSGAREARQCQTRCRTRHPLESRRRKSLGKALGAAAAEEKRVFGAAAAGEEDRRRKEEDA